MKPMHTTTSRPALSAVVAAAAIGGASALSAGPWDYDKIVIRRTTQFIADLDISWGNNVSYGLRTSTTNNGYAPADRVYSGTVSGTAPTANAQWAGNMRAMVVGHKRRNLGDILGGVVNIGFSAQDNELDIAIHRIRNLTLGTTTPVAHVIPFVPFRNVAVTAEGEFSANVTGRGVPARLHGRFHGSGHENITFDFEAHGMVGAGGAIRYANVADLPARPRKTGSIRRGGTRYTVASGDATFSLEVPETGLSDLMASHSGTATGTAPTADARWEGRARAIVVGEGARDAPFRGDLLGGWVAVRFFALTNQANVAIHAIRNIDRGERHVIPFVPFRGVAVTDAGEFSASVTKGGRVVRALDGRFYGTDHRDFAFTFAALGMRGGGGGTRATEAPPEWAEERRVRLAIAGLLADSGFDNARDSSDTWVAPDSVETAADGAVDFSDWSCGFRENANKFSCEISGSQVSLVADLHGARAGVSDVPLREIGGIQLADVGGRRAPYRGVRRYGAWMEHAGFHLYTGVRAESTDANTQLQAGQAFTIADTFGTRSGSAPNATATYEGAMVGTPVLGQANHGDVLVGDAVLGYDPDMGNVFTLSFANLYNVDKREDHNVNEGEHRSDTSLTVAPLHIGLASASADDGSLPEVRVAFYGPNHEEVAGTFDLPKLIGAFGAKRQGQTQQEQPAESP